MVSLAVTRLPSASTTRAAIRLSHVRPYLRVSQPTPPPSARPPTPVGETTPAGVTRPWRGTPVDVAQQSAAAHGDGSPLRVDLDRVHRAEVDDEAVVAGGLPRDAVPSAAHGDDETALAAKARPGHDVVLAGTAQDRRRAAIDHRVPADPRLVVAGVGGPDHRRARAEAARDPRSQAPLDRALDQVHLRLPEVVVHLPLVLVNGHLHSVSVMTLTSSPRPSQ